MADWKYGDAGDLYPMKRGEIWKVGEAYIAVGDLEEGDAMSLLTRCQEDFGLLPTAFYCDPPWNKGNAKSFRTKAFGKENSRVVDFLGSLLPLVVQACRMSSGIFAIEMGDRHVDDLTTELMKQGANGTSVTSITYYKKYPCNIVCGSFGACSVAAIDASEFQGVDDELTPEIFIKPFGMDTVFFDCCVGQGLTCIVADVYERASIGMELSPRRAACGVKAIAERTGLKPELVGNFL